MVCSRGYIVPSKALLAVLVVLCALCLAPHAALGDEPAAVDAPGCNPPAPAAVPVHPAQPENAPPREAADAPATNGPLLPPADSPDDSPCSQEAPGAAGVEGSATAAGSAGAPAADPAREDAPRMQDLPASGQDNPICADDAAQAATAECAPIDYDAVTLPARYFLTNLGQVTPVRSYSPWSSCWAFANTTALESAILKALDPLAGFSADGSIDASLFETPQLADLSVKADLSEMAAAWLSARGDAQGSLADKDGRIASPADSGQRDGRRPVDGFDAYIEALWTAFQSIAANETADSSRPRGCEDPTGWLLDPNSDLQEGRSPDAGSTLDSLQRVRVRGVLRLPSPTGCTRSDTDDEGRHPCQGYDAHATEAVKRALVQYGAVAVSYQSGTASPGQDADANFMDAEHWTQYNDLQRPTPDHEAAIVGWDDGIPAEWFSTGSDGTPPGNGAWLVKDSWSEFLGNHALGTPDAFGIDGSGFFWLSYYDHSIGDPIAYAVERARDHTGTLDATDLIREGVFLADVAYQHAFPDAQSLFGEDGLLPAQTTPARLKQAPGREEATAREAAIRRTTRDAAATAAGASAASAIQDADGAVPADEQETSGDFPASLIATPSLPDNFLPTITIPTIPWFVVFPLGMLDLVLVGLAVRITRRRPLA